MNEEDTLGPSVVNDHQQPSTAFKCLKRNLIQLRRQQRSPIPQTLTSMPTPLQVDTNETNTTTDQKQQLNVSFNNKNDTKAKHFLEIKQNVSPEKIVMPDSSVCNMCCRKDDVCVNLQHNHATVLTVSDITRLPVSNVLFALNVYNFYTNDNNTISQFSFNNKKSESKNIVYW